MSNFDNLVKSRSNDWIPTFAGMTVFVSAVLVSDGNVAA